MDKTDFSYYSQHSLGNEDLNLKGFECSGPCSGGSSETLKKVASAAVIIGAALGIGAIAGVELAALTIVLIAGAAALAAALPFIAGAAVVGAGVVGLLAIAGLVAYVAYNALSQKAPEEIQVSDSPVKNPIDYASFHKAFEIAETFEKEIKTYDFSGFRSSEESEVQKYKGLLDSAPDTFVIENSQDAQNFVEALKQKFTEISILDSTAIGKMVAIGKNYDAPIDELRDVFNGLDSSEKGLIKEYFKLFYDINTEQKVPALVGSSIGPTLAPHVDPNLIARATELLILNYEQVFREA